MANVADFISNDGVLRSLLAKTVNNTPTAIYPKTHSDIVIYKETSVEDALNNLSIWANNISNLLSSTIQTINTLDLSTYSKTYIDALQAEINNSIVAIQKSITSIRSDIEDMSFYTKDQYDQGMYDISAEVNRLSNQVTVFIDNLSSYISSNYDDVASEEVKLSLVYKALNETREAIYSDNANTLNQLRASLRDLINTKFENYYNKEQTDAIHTEYENSHTVEMNLLRGDVYTMNQKAASDVNQYTQVMKQEILNTQSDMLNEYGTNILNTLNNNHNMDSILNKELKNSIDSLYTMIESKFPSGEYESADEEEF